MEMLSGEYNVIIVVVVVMLLFMCICLMSGGGCFFFLPLSPSNRLLLGAGGPDLSDP